MAVYYRHTIYLCMVCRVACSVQLCDHKQTFQYFPNVLFVWYWLVVTLSVRGNTDRKKVLFKSRKLRRNKQNRSGFLVFLLLIVLLVT